MAHIDKSYRAGISTPSLRIQTVGISQCCSRHSKTPLGEEQNIFATLTVRIYCTFGSSKTGLCNKVWAKIRSVEFELFHTKVKLGVCFGMQFAVLDAPYLWPYFVAKSSLWRSVRRYVPWVWHTDFEFQLVVFRCDKPREQEQTSFSPKSGSFHYFVLNGKVSSTVARRRGTQTFTWTSSSTGNPLHKYRRAIDFLSTRTIPGPCEGHRFDF